MGQVLQSSCFKLAIRMKCNINKAKVLQVNRFYYDLLGSFGFENGFQQGINYGLTSKYTVCPTRSGVPLTIGG